MHVQCPAVCTCLVCDCSGVPTNWRDVPLEHPPPDDVLVLPQSNPKVRGAVLLYTVHVCPHSALCALYRRCTWTACSILVGSAQPLCARLWRYRRSLHRLPRSWSMQINLHACVPPTVILDSSKFSLAFRFRNSFCPHLSSVVYCAVY